MGEFVGKNKERRKEKDTKKKKSKKSRECWVRRYPNIIVIIAITPMVEREELVFR